MKKSRIKKNLPQITTRADAEATVGEIALITANRDRLARNMDLDLASIRDRYLPNLLAYESDLKEKTDALCAWAQANPGEFPKNRKSIHFIQGTIGFRTGTPKLALLSRAWSWTKVLAALITNGGQLFVRTTDTVDKERILSAHAAGTLSSEWVTRLGLKITQDESFFVDPNLTGLDAPLKSEISNQKS